MKTGPGPQADQPVAGAEAAIPDFQVDRPQKRYEGEAQNAFGLCESGGGYLAEHLAFPFEAKQSSPIGPHRDTESSLSVIRLLDPVREYAPEEMHGLICKAEQKGARIELPLDRIDVAEDSPQNQLLEDYRHWLWNRQ